MPCPMAAQKQWSQKTCETMRPNKPSSFSFSYSLACFLCLWHICLCSFPYIQGTQVYTTEYLPQLLSNLFLWDRVSHWARRSPNGEPGWLVADGHHPWILFYFTLFYSLSWVCQEFLHIVLTIYMRHLLDIFHLMFKNHCKTDAVLTKGLDPLLM